MSPFKMAMASKRPGQPNKDINDWNPLKDAYDDPKFNSYQEGPGTNLEVHRQLGRKEKGEPFKLYVRDIPVKLDENGIENTFRHFGQPFNVYKHPPLPNSSKTWAFVSFDSYREAEAAIRDLNNKPPLKLKVEFARANDGKEQHILPNTVDDIQEMPIFPRRSGFQFPRPKGGGRGYIQPTVSLPGMDLRRPGLYEYEDEDPAYFQPHRGSPYDESNSIVMKGRMTNVGRNSVTNGRPFFNRSADEMMNCSFESSLQPDQSSKVLFLLESDFLQNENARMEHCGVEKPKGSLEGPCTYCSRVCTTFCRRCHQWYCSRTCQENDWPVHKSLCEQPPPLASRPKEEDEMSKDSDGKSSDTSPRNEDSDYRRQLATNKGLPQGQNNFSKGKTQRPLTQKRIPDTRQREHDLKQISMPREDKQYPKKQHEPGNRHGYDKRGYDKGPKARDAEHSGGEQRNTYQKDYKMPQLQDLKSDSEKKSARDPGHAKGPRVRDSEQNGYQKGHGISERPGLGNAVKNSSPKSVANEEKPTSPHMYQVERLPTDTFSTVKVVVALGATEYWVYMNETEHFFLDLANKITKEGNFKKCIPEVGSFCIALFQQLWFRAKITSVNPLKVFYIDYGNEETCSLENIRLVPESAKNYNAQAMRIKLAPGTSQMRHNLPPESLLRVKPVGKTKEGAILVHVEGDKYEPLPEDNDTSSLEAADGTETDSSTQSVQNVVVLLRNGMSGFLQVNEYNSEEDFISSLVCTDHNSQYSLIHSPAFNKECERAPDNTQPQVGDAVLAKASEGSWIRAFVVKVSKEKYIVASCETGLVEIVDKVKVSPEKYREIVTFAVQCKVSEWLQTNKPSNLMGIAKFSFTVESTTHSDAVIILSNDDEPLCKVTVTEWIPPYHLYEPLKCVELNDGLCVMTSYISSRIVYVRPSSKAVTEQTNKLLQKIAAHCFKVPTLSTPPKVGQVLGSMFSCDRNYYRARVQDVSGKNITVVYIDFGNIETVTIENLKPLPEEIINSPCLAVKIVLKDVVDKPLNEAAVRLLNEIMGSEAELNIKLSGPASNQADLHTSDGTHLNKELNKLLEPSWKKEMEPENVKFLTYKETTSEDLPIGQTVELVLNVCMEFDQLIVTPKKSKILQVLKAHFQSTIDEYCNTTAQKSYVPRVDEVCLAKVDGKWYRCACLDTGMEIALIFLDYGRVVKVPHTDVRSMPKEFAEIPTAGVYCEVQMPGKEKPKVQKYAQEYFSSMREILATIIEKRENDYIIEVEDLNANLKSSRCY